MAVAPLRLCNLFPNHTNLNFSLFKPNVLSLTSFSPSPSSFSSLSQKQYLPLHSCRCSSIAPVSTTTYEFSDGSAEVELRLKLGGLDIRSPRDISVDTNDTSLAIRVLRPGAPITLIETNPLFDRIKSSETIWYIDDDELVVNCKKQDPDLKWPDIMESWESLAAGSSQLLQGTSIYLVGDSTEINQKVAQELATGLGYTPLSTKELLETYTNQTVDSWLLAEGSDSVAEAESAVLESISSHARAVVATLGGQHGASGRANKWQHLYAGFTVWLSQTEALDEDSAKEETHKSVKDGTISYTNADVVVKLQGWDPAYAKSVAQACLSALKQLILSDKKLPGKKKPLHKIGMSW
ncbi:probable inactive shikimate kinase like 2, chloroplastic isoform X2 [Vigna radiata var. radiata]|uniref:Probable inactive shikimate kinase like 2, chloroplastic isoform X2 n=1 Tax=Vigna radiata var. radiata TaxID=3916 RepID=A0A3Q0EMJ8_VIGRR|nr:probable inactive shikimate kinase like 2, chloroplastic isoform X2 [Vigna radiata var. radiata]